MFRCQAFNLCTKRFYESSALPSDHINRDTLLVHSLLLLGILPRSWALKRCIAYEFAVRSVSKQFIEKEYPTWKRGLELRTP